MPPRPASGPLERRTGRKAVFAALYFTEGAPIGFLWWALPTVWREAGGEVERIGALLAFLALPWAFKFLWAPLVDVLRGPRFGLRAWIVSSQLVMGASLLPLLWASPAGRFGWLALALLVHAFAAATQDVAIDNLAIQSTRADERGALNGWMQVGMLSGRSLFGGGALLARDILGDRGVILALAGVLFVSAGAVLLMIDPATGARSAAPENGPGASSPWRAFGRHLAAAARRRSTWYALAFAATAGAGFEAVGALAGPHLIDRGLDSSEVGAFFALPAVAAMAVGALAGGWLADRTGRRRTIVFASLALNGAILAMAAAGASSGATPTTLAFANLLLVYVGIGCFTASTYALFMDLTDTALGSTQFSAFMGATNLCEAWSVFAAGRIVTAAGYPLAFVAMAVVALVALVFLLRAR